MVCGWAPLRGQPPFTTYLEALGRRCAAWLSFTAHLEEMGAAVSGLAIWHRSQRSDGLLRGLRSVTMCDGL
ncbi:MAG TPA: hypothetical protein VGD98_05590 [Ktedonobacteraceae bacterium]